MAYRRYSRRRRPARRYRKKKGQWMNTAWKVARTALTTANTVKGLINAEFKKHESTITSTFDYNGTFIQLNQIAQGVDSNQRTGRSIKMQFLELRGVIAVAAGVSGSFRCVGLLDKCNEMASWSDVYDISGTSSAPYSFKNYDVRFKTKNLWDKKYYVNPNDATLIQLVPIHIRIPLKYHCQYVGTAATDIDTNAVAFMIVSDNSTAANYTCRLNFRLLYTDN